MPKNLEGFIDPIKMWTKYDGDSKVPGAFSYLPNVIMFSKKEILHFPIQGYNRDLLPEKRPRKANDAPPSPPPKMDFSISQYRDQFETSPTSDKENYVVKIHENYVVRVPESLVRRLEENKRRDAERGGRGMGRGRGGGRGAAGISRRCHPGAQAMRTIA